MVLVVLVEGVGGGYARVVAEVGVGAVEHGEIGLEGEVSALFWMDEENW